MTVSIIVVIAVILLAIYLFATERFPVDATALSVAAFLMVTGILSPEEGLSGFSDVGTLSVFALLALSLGLESTGAVNLLGNELEKRLLGTEAETIVGLSLMVGLCSAFLNNTAIVAIMLPVTARLSAESGISVSKLLMPLSFAAMAGGTITIIGTSTNVIIAGIYANYSGEAFSIFEFSAIGLSVFLTYLFYMTFIGRHLLPSRSSDDSLSKDYELGKYLTQVRVNPSSPLIGHRFGESELVRKYDITVIELIREGDQVWLPEHGMNIRADDILVVKCDLKSLMKMANRLGLAVFNQQGVDDEDLTSEQTVLFEAVIGNNSFLLGKKIKDIDFRGLFAAVPLGVRRHGESVESSISNVEIKFGDTILLEARRGKLEKFYNSRDFIVLEQVKRPTYRKKRMKRSAAIIFAVIALVATGLLRLEVAAITGVALMFLTGCVSPRYVYRKMEWRIVFLLAGLIPLGIAVEKVGLSALVASGILDAIGPNPLLLVVGLFSITVALTSFMSNSATAILLAPLAINLAEQLQISPKAFLVTVMFAASTSFLTPIGYQTNTLIYGPGKYTFGDYFRVGGLLTLLVMIVCTSMVYILYL